MGDNQEEKLEESPIEEEGDDDGFMQGYEDENEAEECVECGVAVSEEKRVLREIDGEEYLFCSKTCADDFEESMESSEE